MHNLKFSNYISFSIDKLRFIDSFQFLNSSLENLVENLASDSADAFQYFKKEFSHQHSELLLRKGIYPYEYIDSESRFEETELPPIESFYSQIKAETISQSEYAHALAVYKTFGLKNLGEYHDLYLRTDVVLLCDVFVLGAIWLGSMSLLHFSGSFMECLSEEKRCLFRAAL